MMCIRHDFRFILGHAAIPLPGYVSGVPLAATKGTHASSNVLACAFVGSEFGLWDSRVLNGFVRRESSSIFCHRLIHFY